MKSKVTTIQFFDEDVGKIKTLAEVLGEEMGGKVSQRVAVMIAINKLLKGEDQDG